MLIEKLTVKDRNPLKKIINNVGVFNKPEVDCALELIDVCLYQKEESGYIIHVAKLNKQPLGYICYGPTPLTHAVFDMYWLVVDKPFHGQGIGRNLMRFMENQLCSEARMVIIETSSRKPYEQARRLYRAMDYNLVATITDFYDHGDAKLIFSKNFVRRGIHND